MTNMTQDQLAQLIASVVGQVLAGQAAKATPSAKPVDRLAQKDRALVAGFRRKGIPEADIKLMNRADPKAEYNVRPFQGWLNLGWQVRKGERSIKGLFHQSQCDRIAPKAPAKGKFGKAKAQPTLV